jgi:hypothetical protein
MNYLLLAFVLQIFGLYAMILTSDYLTGVVSSYRSQRRLKKSPVRVRR